MDRVLHVGSREYRKNATGVFEVSVSDLGELHFLDIPTSSTVEVAELPGSTDRYKLSVGFTHAGDDELWLHCHVTFHQLGSPEDPVTRQACSRKLERIVRTFRPLVDARVLAGGFEDERRTYFSGGWNCGILFTADFTQQDNPRLADLVDVIAAQFHELLASPDVLFFVCHASEDKPFVDTLAAFLDSEDVPIWYDKREIRAGDSIVARISEGLGAASHLVMVLSQVSTTKPWVQREFSLALMKQLQDQSITVVPLLREDCTIPPLLADIKYVDCRGDSQAGFRSLLNDTLGRR